MAPRLFSLIGRKKREKQFSPTPAAAADGRLLCALLIQTAEPHTKVLAAPGDALPKHIPQIVDAPLGNREFRVGILQGFRPYAADNTMVCSIAIPPGDETSFILEIEVSKDGTLSVDVSERISGKRLPLSITPGEELSAARVSEQAAIARTQIEGDLVVVLAAELRRRREAIRELASMYPDKYADVTLTPDEPKSVAGYVAALLRDAESCDNTLNLRSPLYKNIGVWALYHGGPLGIKIYQRFQIAKYLEAAGAADSKTLEVVSKYLDAADAIGIRVKKIKSISEVYDRYRNLLDNTPTL